MPRKPSLCDHCANAYEVAGGFARMSSGPGQSTGAVDAQQRYCRTNRDAGSIHFSGLQECEHYAEKEVRVGDVRDLVAGVNEEALMADGFDEAIIGMCFRAGGQPPLVAYDYTKCIEILQQRDGMTKGVAEEFFDFNVLQAWMGEETPVFIVRFEELLEE